MDYYRLIWSFAINFKRIHPRVNFEAEDFAQEGCLLFDSLVTSYTNKVDNKILSCRFSTFLVNSLNYHFLNLSAPDMDKTIDYTIDPEKVAEIAVYDVNFEPPIIERLSDTAWDVFSILIGANETFLAYLLKPAPPQVPFQRKICQFLGISQKEYIKSENTIRKEIKNLY